MFSEGKSRAQFCAKHSIASDTFDDWKKQHPIFNKAYQVAIQKAQAYYDDLRQSHLVQDFEGSSINAAMFNRMYNVRFNVPEKRLINSKSLAKAKNERAMVKAIMNAVSKGELTPDEAQKLAGLIDISLRVTQIQELEKRLMLIEESQKLGTNDGFGEL